MLTLVGYIADYNNLNYPLKAMDMNKVIYTLNGPLINYEKVLGKSFEVLLFDCFLNDKFVGKYCSRAVIGTDDITPSNYVLIKTVFDRKVILRKHLF